MISEQTWRKVREICPPHYMGFDADGKAFLIAPGDPQYKEAAASFKERLRNLFAKVPRTGRETYDYLNPLKDRK